MAQNVALLIKKIQRFLFSLEQSWALSWPLDPYCWPLLGALLSVFSQQNRLLSLQYSVSCAVCCPSPFLSVAASVSLSSFLPQACLIIPVTHLSSCLLKSHALCMSWLLHVCGLEFLLCRTWSAICNIPCLSQYSMWILQFGLKHSTVLLFFLLGSTVLCCLSVCGTLF